MVELERVSVTYPGGVEVLRELDLEAPTGAITVLLGRSGSGKTTVLRLINALILPSGGAVRVAGRDTRDWDPIELRRRTGYVMQHAGLLPHYDVARNVGLVPSLAGEPRDAIADRVRALLELVRLDPDELAQRMPHELSGGQRQRVGIARALAADPPLLLCDEPFGALDPITRRELQRELRELASSLGKTVVFVTHDVREALLVGDRITLLAGGDLAFSGPPAAFRSAEHAEARAFLDGLEV